MSAVGITIRLKKIIAFLRDHHAVSPETAILESEIPYSNKWYYRRLIRSGSIKKMDEKCYLDEPVAKAYLQRKRVLALVAFVVVIVLLCLYGILKAHSLITIQDIR